MEECEAELNKVMPPLLKVLKELRNIDKGSIAELKVGAGCVSHLACLALVPSGCGRWGRL